MSAVFHSPLEAAAGRVAAAAPAKHIAPARTAPAAAAAVQQAPEPAQHAPRDFSWI